ncbi:hypothetical protein EMPS_04838 [Entomortierella parvispora]|uniref:Guanylate cyclase domain-containing protein n=1 Tax=Entomortierella parvispora TaxID=205924 RepID=A0A9P3H998_9FUNG|nr:hypothetical protein EMPS_04838 [Entomortierella parvispora]
MTTIASSKGDFGAEMLSSQIGAYFDQAIRIIEYHGGDVVKFLGDALLVVFQPDPNLENHAGAESPTSTNPLDSPTREEPTNGTASRRDRVIVRKAVDCGLELLTRLSNYRIDLSEKDYARKLTGPNQEDSSGGAPNSPFEDGNTASMATMNSNQSGNSNSQWNNSASSSSGSIGASSFLSVPVARPNSNSQSGTGSSSRRSSVPSNAVSPTTPTMPQKFASVSNLDLTANGGGGSGGLGGNGGSGGFRKRDDTLLSSRPASTTSKKKVGSFFANAKNLFTHSTFSDRNAVPAEDIPDESHDLQLHMALTAGPISNIIIGDIGSENGLDNLLMQNTGRLEYAICGEQMAEIEEALNMARAGELTVTGTAMGYINPESYPFEIRRQYHILKSINNLSVDPLLRRIRNDKLFNTSVESNPHYYKYINKSAIHRLILNPDNNFPAQFRTVTILFVSLGDIKPWTPEGLAICQKAIFQVHKVTSEYEGKSVRFIQQFAVDDKGATLLCAFGLPYPRSHEREAVFAAKSAWMIRRRLLTQGIEGFKISLATGVIFTSMIGNEFRRDPAIVGDTIVIAVRILKIEHAMESVVCDDATKEACTSDNDGLCEFEDMGEFFVKGKIHPLRIWRLIHFGAKKQIRRPDDIMVDETIGYEPEREKVSQFISSWEKVPDRNTILVSGPRGSGKSMFYQQICHISDRNGYHVCSAASAEVEKNTQYYLCKFLMLGLFDIMRRKEIPYAAKGFNNLMSTSRDLGISGLSPGYGELHRRQTSSTPSTANLSISSGGLNQSLSTDPSPLETPSGTRTPVEGLASPSQSHLGPSVRSSVASNVPWDLSLSPTISPFGEQSKRSSTYVTKLQQLIKVSLQKMGEGDEMMHMLHDIIAALSSDYSAPVMDDQDDQMLADFIVRMLNYASTFVKIIVMFEDVQWTDSKSLDIIQAIHDRCPKVLVVIFSRPQRDYGGNILRNITGHFKHLEISIDGLKRREIELALLKTFEENGVTKISPEVTELVQTKTKGNPKFVKNMANMLKDFCHVNIVEGELVSTGQDSDLSGSYQNAEEMEQMLVKQDRKKMILMQYDRMPPKFQDFLKIASCLGDQFSLAEVSAIRPLESMLGVPEPGRSFPTMISDLDTFRFLSITTDHQQTNVKFSEDVVMNTLYTFGSSSTATDIYESIPYEERVSYHLTMGQFYESFLEPSQLYESVLDPGQFSDLLPLISRHYLKTEATEKKIKYLKALSAFDLKSNMLSDASQRLSDLIDIVNTARGGNGAGMVSEADLADIYGMKGEALSRRMRIDEAEPALLDSLKRYGIHWPETPQQWRVALLMEKWKFNLHGVATPPSPRRKPAKAKVDNKTKTNLQRIIRVLGCLQNIYFWKTEPNAAMLSTLYTLNYSRKLGLPSSEQTVSLGRYGILNYFKGNKQTCMEYMEKARIADEAGDGTDGMLLSMRGYIEYCEGRPESAHRMFADAISESKSFGVVSNFATFYRSVILKCAYRMWEGSFNVHPEDSALLRAMSAVAIQNGDSEGETLFAIPTLANLLIQDRLRDAESWVVLIERHIMPKSRLMNLLVIHGMLSYYYSKMGHFSKARIYAELVAERLHEQGVAAHPFPLMCCAFTIMSLYEMLDSSSSQNNSTCGPGPLVPSSSTSSFSSTQLSSVLGSGSASCSTSGSTVNDSSFCVHKTDMILRPVIHCLTQDPFQSVALCFVTLADALRHFVHQGNQHQQREGLHKLHRSWERFSKELEGIQFVKAYYLTRMGRHSEDPREKSRHYCDAYVLFVSMAMDPSGWLTDLPVNWQEPKAAGLIQMESTIGSIATPS